MSDKKSNSALVTAKRAEIKADIGNGDISSILTTQTSLQNQILALQNSLVVANANIASLLASYNSHIHTYTDVDNLGVTNTKNTTTHQ